MTGLAGGAGAAVRADTVARARLRGDRSQQVFDVLLRTLAEPGLIRELPAGLTDEVPAVAWPALALADVDVPIAVAGPDADVLEALIAAATDAPVVDPGGAAIVILTGPDPAVLDRVPVGSALAPEDGARVVVAVDGFGGFDHRPVSLNGPGVAGRFTTRIGTDGETLARLGNVDGRFPVGFDTWLIDPAGRVMGIPRSTGVAEVATGTVEEE